MAEFQSKPARVGRKYRFHVELDSVEAPWDEEITGRVVLAGEGGNRRFRRILVSLVASYGPSVGSTDEVRWEHVELDPGGERRLPFAIRTPWGKTFQTGYVYTHVTLDFWSIPAGIQAPVRIVPPRIFTGLVDQLAELSGLPEVSYQLSAGGDGVLVMLRPGPGQRHAVAAIQMELLRAKSVLYGSLTVATGSSMLIRLPNEAERIPFRLPADRPGEAAAFFTQCLRPYLDDLKDLPIPSAPGAVSGENLPLPAFGPEPEAGKE